MGSGESKTAFPESLEKTIRVSTSLSEGYSDEYSASMLGSVKHMCENLYDRVSHYYYFVTLMAYLFKDLKHDSTKDGEEEFILCDLKKQFPNNVEDNGDEVVIRLSHKELNTLRKAMAANLVGRTSDWYHNGIKEREPEHKSELWNHFMGLVVRVSDHHDFDTESEEDE
jgi:hypothetical protein